MASTSTSPSVTLELRDVETGSLVTVPAFGSPRGGNGADVYLNGIVAEECVYDMTLVSSDPIDVDLIEVAVNGGDAIRADILNPAPTIRDDKTEYRYSIVLQGRTNRVGANEQDKLFFQTYGFARVELRIPGFGDFVSMDVPCACVESVNVGDVRLMLKALLDNEDRSITDWMFSSDADNESEYALLEGDSRQDGSKTLVSFIGVIQGVLDTYETWLSYFRSNGHCVILSESKCLAGFDVRQLGVDEFVWLMRNADVLSEVQADTGLAHNGRNYFPRYIDTQVKTKSFDNYENRVVLSFLADVLSAIKRVETGVRDEVELLQSRIARLDTLRGAQILPALIVMEEYESREVSFLDQLESQRARAQRLYVGYKNALPGVREQLGVAQNPKRTKVFQEVYAYSTIFLQIEHWRAYGEFSLARESLALHTLKLDKLYEYYALYLLLKAFQRNGYVLDDAYIKPYQRVLYSLDAPKFTNERMVNNLYRLKANGTHVALYYQPVIYCDAREEHGITFHKKSPRRAFAPNALDSYYLPDYVLFFEKDGVTKTFALDAKYSTVGSLVYMRNDWNKFNEAYFKYVADTINDSMKSIDALWLLAGKEDIPGAKIYETASWIRSVDGYTPSGIVPASPTVDNLDELFGILGLIDGGQGAASGDDDDGEKRIQGELDGPEESSIAIAASEDKPDVLSETELDESQTHKMVALVHTEEETGLSAAKTDIVNQVEKLLIIHLNHKDLQRQGWCVSKFGVNSPVIRDRKPRNRKEARKYSLQTLSIGEAYVLVAWRPNQLNMLRRFLAQHEQKTV